MKDFLKQLPALWALYKKDQEEKAKIASLLNQGVTEEFIKGLMATAEEGVEATLSFPGGVVLTITRKPNELVTAYNSGLKTKETF